MRDEANKYESSATKYCCKSYPITTNIFHRIRNRVLFARSESRQPSSSRLNILKKNNPSYIGLRSCRCNAIQTTEILRMYFFFCFDDVRVFSSVSSFSDHTIYVFQGVCCDDVSEEEELTMIRYVVLRERDGSKKSNSN